MQLIFFLRTFIVIALVAAGSYIFILMHKPFGKAPDKQDLVSSPQYQNGKFVNTVETSSADFGQLPDILKRQIKNDVESRPTSDYTFEEEKLAPADFATDSLLVNWLGHASLLIHHNGSYILTDPVFSERASPFSFLGPSRFFETPISIDEMPPLEAIIISHDHYDHLDYESITALEEKTKTFVVPLGVAETLRYWGIPDEKIVEMDWWDETKTGEFEITATPARHFSGRLFKRNNTLWNSYTIRSGGKNIFFAGDSGFFEKYSEIGERQGPFDLSLIPIGAYDKAWADIHLNPEEAARVWDLVNGGKLIPIHWGTYDLGLHSWYDPIERMIAATKEKDIPLLTPRPGEWINPKTYTPDWNWWMPYSKRKNGQPET